MFPSFPRPARFVAAIAVGVAVFVIPSTAAHADPITDPFCVDVNLPPPSNGGYVCTPW